MGLPPRPRPGRPSAGSLYRLARMLHAYLSAFAFLALIFFSLTGLTLNHPDWLAGRRQPEETREVALAPAAVAAALKADDPARALAAAVERAHPVPGAYASGEVLDGEALLRFEGPTGTTDVTVTTATGRAELATRRAGLVATLNDLHKGKAAGAAWKLVIDLSAVLFILLSLIGYVIFFSMRFRLPLSLILTGVSLVALVGAFFLFVA
jgi:hypothetical protein